MILPDISNFINKYITNRNESLFKTDLDNYSSILTSEIKNKSILVIGGAGTIGSSFIKAALKYHPSKLIVVDLNENGLTELTRSLRSDNKIIVPEIYLTYPISFNSSTFYKLFKKHKKFDIIANFAAHKHVRSEKDFFSIEAMLKNNVTDAKDLLDLLSNNKPSHFFCVSTDKAANPVNVMGASKKLMEKIIMSYSSQMKITTARFANVAFSNGSLLNGYVNRIMQRQPISCPSDVLRYFVSPEESGEICLLTCIIGNSGDIFFPKLSENQMINFKSITIDFFKYLNKEIMVFENEAEAKKAAVNISDESPYPVYFFKTDTSGEKLYEEFFNKDDELDLSSFDSLGVIKNFNNNNSEIELITEKIIQIYNSNYMKKEKLINILNSIISDFNHIESGKSLDQKM